MEITMKSFPSNTMSAPSVLSQGDFKQNSWDFPEIETLPSNVGGVTIVGVQSLVWKLWFHMPCDKKKKKKKKKKTEHKSQKQYCNKFNKDFQDGPFQKKS